MSDEDKRFTQADLDAAIKARLATAKAQHDATLATVRAEAAAALERVKTLEAQAAEWEPQRVELENVRRAKLLDEAGVVADESVRARVVKLHEAFGEGVPLEEWIKDEKTKADPIVSALFKPAATTTTNQPTQVPIKIPATSQGAQPPPQPKAKLTDAERVVEHGKAMARARTIADPVKRAEAIEACRGILSGDVIPQI